MILDITHSYQVAKLVTRDVNNYCGNYGVSPKNNPFIMGMF